MVCSPAWPLGKGNMTLSREQRSRWQARVESAIAERCPVGSDSTARYFLVGSRRVYALAKIENHSYSYFDYDLGEWVAHPAVLGIKPDVVEVSPSLAHHLMRPEFVSDAD